MKIYLIPGLGYDDSLFDRLDFNGQEVVPINWIEPKPKEGIRSYARRMLAEVPSDDEDTILIGHSFGGIIAQEVAVDKSISRIILLSSIQSRRELPWYFKLIKPLLLDRFFTKELATKTIKYWGPSHGFVTDSEQAWFVQMVTRHSNHYLQWALRTLSGWHHHPQTLPNQVFQIHGTLDKTFPIKWIEKPDLIVDQGTHIMTFKKSRQLSALLRQALSHGYTAH